MSTRFFLEFVEKPIWLNLSRRSPLWCLMPDLSSWISMCLRGSMIINMFCLSNSWISQPFHSKPTIHHHHYCQGVKTSKVFGNTSFWSRNYPRGKLAIASWNGKRLLFDMRPPAIPFQANISSSLLPRSKISREYHLLAQKLSDYQTWPRGK